MKSWLIQLDQILRGEKTRVDALRSGTIEISLRVIGGLILILGALYGVCMGTFALLRPDGAEVQQMLASAIKVPALFILTLIITFPSLYVFNALVGSRLKFVPVLKLLVAGLAVTLAMLSACGPIVAFFSLSTESYSFMVLLNVLVFAVSGMLGLKFVLQTLHRLTLLEELEPTLRTVPPEVKSVVVNEGESTAVVAESASSPVTPLGPLDEFEGHLLSGQVKLVFRIWVVVFGLIGAQMSWVLRPFIGNVNQPFTWFRPRESNFFEAVAGSIRDLFGL